jgi:nitrite transporter NirC
MDNNLPLPYAIGEAVRKSQVFNHKPLRYFVSAMVAGALITIVLIVSLLLGQILHASGAPLYYAASAGFFGTALCTIIFFKCELFTSNVMYMTVGALSRQLTPLDVLKSWLLVYTGNFAGAMLLAFIYAQTGSMNSWPTTHLLFDVINHKVHADVMAIFWKGVLCNWIICLAVWVPMRLTNEMAKLAMVMLLVFVFFFSGFEHSIANMGFFGLSWFASGGAAPTLADTLHNLIPATLGNIVGGGVGVGMLVFYLEHDTLADKPANTAVKGGAVAHS